jgi:hypothetical protein
MGEKLDTVFMRRYFIDGLVLSLTSFFEAMRGETYIIMIYNATYSGLNVFLWAPWSALPAIRTLFRALEFGTFMSDLDIAEMFLNFMLEAKCQMLVGADLTHYTEKDEGAGGGAIHLEMWGRCLLGATVPHYLTAQGMGHANDMIMGEPRELSNTFHWFMVRLNLAGSELYDPRRAWVAKARPDRRVDAYVFIYIDDFRPTGLDKEEAGIILNHLGIQDAPHKAEGGIADTITVGWVHGLH